MFKKRHLHFSLFLLFFGLSSVLQATVIKGVVTDKTTKEPLIGATVQLVSTSQATLTNIDGEFELKTPQKGTYTIEVRYLGYLPEVQEIELANRSLALEIKLSPDNQLLEEVTVTGRQLRYSDAGILSAQKNSLVVQTGVSAQQIKRTQDSDASEVIRRIPGISIIDDKFVMIRGLSQRYNNVWINQGAVPSSEADSRAFSFDIIPSSQIDNMIIIKSAAPQYPADFTGGFIELTTKSIPDSNSLSISIGSNFNSETHFKQFLGGKRGPTDFLGFDNSLRPLHAGIHTKMNTYPENHSAINLLDNQLNNDWKIRKRHPLGDLKFNLAFNRVWRWDSEKEFGLLASANYSNSYKSYLNMENSLFGSYDQVNNHPVYLRQSKDNQYSQDVKLGMLLNLAYRFDSNHQLEFKNSFNQLGKDRYTEREGFDAQSNREKSMEYYYSARTIYNTQLAGKHTLNDNDLDWTLGYAFSNRNLPDRRRILLNDELESDRIGLTSGTDISREFTYLNEHIGSLNVNYSHKLPIKNINTDIRVGAYGEYRTRDYDTRLFYYNWNYGQNDLPKDFRYLPIVDELLQPNHYAYNQLYLQEQVNKLNDYRGKNTHLAGYLAWNIPLDKLTLYAGLRYEYSKMEVVSNTRTHQSSERSSYYTYNDLFPTLNISYNLNESHQFRFAYGRTINRPEFRELSPSVFYDFELASNVQGNSELEAALIDNIDLRYEFYPSPTELVSLSLFYKHFSNPIEWTYTVNGGTNLTYSYANAKAARNYGVELEIKKNLDFIGLPNLSLNFNGALIKSTVDFEKGSKERKRAMQGQSPYLINTGLFYTHPTLNFNAGVLYNRIGKRIVGVGRSVGTVGGESTSDIPNSYEMPRNSLDLSFGKSFKNFELKFYAKDVIANKVVFKQISESDTQKNRVDEVTKSYRPGRNFGFSIGYTFK